MKANVGPDKFVKIGPNMYEESRQGRFNIGGTSIKRLNEYVDGEALTAERLAAIIIVNLAVSDYIKGSVTAESIGKTSITGGYKQIILFENENVAIFHSLKNKDEGYVRGFIGDEPIDITFEEVREAALMVVLSEQYQSATASRFVPHTDVTARSVLDQSKAAAAGPGFIFRAGITPAEAFARAPQAKPAVSEHKPSVFPAAGPGFIYRAGITPAEAFARAPQTVPVSEDKQQFSQAFINRVMFDNHPPVPLSATSFYVKDHVPSTCGEIGNAAMVKPIMSNSDIGFQSVHESLSGYKLKISSAAHISDAFSSYHIRPSTWVDPVLVIGVDAYKLTSSKFAKNSVIQVASQFNFLESMSPNYAPTQSYMYDRTQGPMASLAVPGALMIRDGNFKENDPQKNLFKGLGDYAGGYFMPFIDGSRKKQTYHSVLGNLSNLGILIQDGYDRHTGTLVTQVFTAAPSYQGTVAPDETSIDAYWCRKFMMVQYEAVAKAAIIKQHLTGKQVNLHLTLVGAGAFNNPTSAATDAVLHAISLASSCGVAVYVHVYSKAANSTIVKVLQEIYTNEMKAEEFFA